MVELVWMALDTVLHAGEHFKSLLLYKSIIALLKSQVTYGFNPNHVQSRVNSCPYGGVPIPVCFLSIKGLLGCQSDDHEAAAAI